MLRVVVLPACLVLPGAPAAAQKKKVGEYEVKAALLYNFLLFIEWPELEDTPAGAPATITIGIVGEDLLGKHFVSREGKLIEAKKKKLIVKRLGRFHDGLDLSECQLLFIASSEKKNLEKILSRVEGNPILTVSEVSGFLEKGGMVNLTKKKGRIRVEINRTPVSVSGLRPSSDLLRIASRVVRIPERGE